MLWGNEKTCRNYKGKLYWGLSTALSRKKLSQEIRKLSQETFGLSQQTRGLSQETFRLSQQIGKLNGETQFQGHFSSLFPQMSDNGAIPRRFCMSLSR